MVEKKTFLKFVVVGILLIQLAVFVSAVDDLFALQGNVQEGGVNLVSGNLTVTIYDAATGGSMIHNSTWINNVSDGKYDVLIGSGEDEGAAANELHLDYGAFYYAEVIVNGEDFDFTGNERQIFQSSVGNLSLGDLDFSDAGVNITLPDPGWFNGLFNWVVNSSWSDYISFNGSRLSISDWANETWSTNHTLFAFNTYNATWDNRGLIGQINTTANIQALLEKGDLNLTSLNVSGLTNASGGLAVTGDSDFNGGWLSGGVSVLGGSVFAQSLFVYNITSLGISNLDVNGSLVPYLNDSFSIGNDSHRFSNGYFSNDVYIDGLSTREWLYNQTLAVFTSPGLNNSIDAYTASTIYYPQNIVTTEGTLDAGNLVSVNVTKDGDTYDVSEDAGVAPVLRVVVNFTDVADFTTMIFRLYYDGTQGHEINFGVYDYDADSYEFEYGGVTDMSGYGSIVIDVTDATNHISGTGEVSIMFDHEQNGNVAHNFYVDYISLVDGFTTSVTHDHDALAGRDEITNHPWALPVNGSLRNASHILVTNNVTASYFIGNGSQLTSLPLGENITKTYHDLFLNRTGAINYSLEYNFTQEVVTNYGQWFYNHSEYNYTLEVANNYVTLGKLQTILNGTDMNFGQVGIGTASPAFQLEIIGAGVRRMGIESTDDTAYLSLESKTDGKESRLGFLNNNAGVWRIRNFNTNNQLQFFDDTNNVNRFVIEQGAGVNALYIDSDSNVGLGTTTPTHRLNVIGASNLSGNVISNGTINSTVDVCVVGGNCLSRASGSVTSITQGAGMAFSEITTTGSIIMALPLTVSGTTTNNAGGAGTGHTHTVTTDDAGACGAGVICGGGHDHPFSEILAGASATNVDLTVGDGLFTIADGGSYSCAGATIDGELCVEGDIQLGGSMRIGDALVSGDGSEGVTMTCTDGDDIYVEDGIVVGCA